MRPFRQLYFAFEPSRGLIKQKHRKVVRMSFIKAAGNARQLSVIESAYSQELDSTAMHDSSEDSTEQKDFAVTDFSFGIPSPANGGPQAPSQPSSRTLNPLSTDDLHHQRQASKDIEKNDAATLSSDESGPEVAEIANHDKHDPFAQESGGGVQYRTMAWWYAHLYTYIFLPIQLLTSPTRFAGKQAWL